MRDFLENENVFDMHVEDWEGPTFEKFGNCSSR